MFNSISYALFKSLAFRLDPESAHQLALRSLSLFPGLFAALPADPRLSVQVGSLRWPFPIGLAAGLDKDAVAVDFFTRIFGGVEVGTVTRSPQGGNPRPRLFRLTEEQSLRNKMGFNSAGAEVVLRNLQSARRNGKILGVNIGANKSSRGDEVLRDYRELLKMFEGAADYLVINVSSPNTPGLREYQRGEKVRALLRALDEVCGSVPLFLKVSPDLEDEELTRVCELAKEFSLAGLVAVNTSAAHDLGEGGLSGRLLRQRARRVRHFLLDCLRETPELSLVGVGGFEDFSDLLAFWRAGGRAAQVYTAFIYQGPALLERFRRDILALLQQTGARDLDELLSAPESL